LRSVAKEKGMTVVRGSLVQPWLDQEDTLRASLVLSSPLAAAASTGESVSEPSGSSGLQSTEDARRDQTPEKVARTAQDEIMFDVPGERVNLDLSSHPIAGLLVEKLADSIPKDVAPASRPQGDISDHVKSLDSEKTSWQHQKYSPESFLWQGAALRRRVHPRMSTKSLGVCSVDLSGPHEPTPRPGNQIQRDRILQQRHVMPLSRQLRM